MVEHTDDKGRPNPADMTQKEMLTEILLTFRQLADALETLGNNPMLKAMMPGVRL